jgi:putative hydrolase of the HAD superfamily
MIKAVCFDVGHTLIKYNNPLDWSSLYRPALEASATSCGFFLTEDMISRAVKILTEYNTRINPRETEVTSNIIFGEMMRSLGRSLAEVRLFAKCFYLFFNADAEPYPDAVRTLKMLKKRGLKTGILTDVAYGMDNEFSLKDIETLSGFIDYSLTSVDVGLRKPNPTGFIRLSEHLGVSRNEAIYIGDEEKDVVGAICAGMIPVLICRSGAGRNYNQVYTISSLSEIVEIVDILNGN